jgi:hypothetical protein
MEELRHCSQTQEGAHVYQVLMRVMLAFGIHVYVISILVLCLNHLRLVWNPLSSLNLIPNLSIVKGYKCQSYVQSKQSRKPHKAAEERHLALLEFIHSDMCEMNDVLTEGEQRYFMTMIDDASRYCYVYLLKTKDEALCCFKTYNAKVENQLEKKDQTF